MMKETTTELNAILEKIQKLERSFLELKVLVEERQKRKQYLEKECQKLGLDPNNLEIELQKLVQQKDTLSTSLNKKLDELENLLKEYGSETV